MNRTHVDPSLMSTVNSMLSSVKEQSLSHLIRTSPVLYPDLNDSWEWNPFTQIQMSHVELNQISLHLCLELMNQRKLSWILSDKNLIEVLSDLMGRSEALTYAIYAHATTHYAKLCEATEPHRLSVGYYGRAIAKLQNYFYDPVHQKSEETLMTIILLGLFEV